jgi:serine/threonine protein kinase
VPAVNIVLRDALSALVLVQGRLQRPALAEIAEAELVFEGGGGAGGAGGAGGGAGALGAGAYGVVRHASWKGTPVAVKSLQRAAGDENAAAARAFDNEMRALAALHHPNIVHVFGTCHHADGRVSLVEDLAEGGDLYKKLHPRGGPSAALPLAEALRVGLDVARGLAFAHGKGCTHNDLKSLNVVLDRGGKAVIVDFGLVKRVRDALPNTMAHILSSASGEGGLLGTPAWTAPENFNDEDNPHYGQRPGDVYSFGCILFEMVTGATPWAGKNIGQICVAVTGGRRPAIPAGVDDDMKRVITSCWASDPAARPTSAVLVGELTTILQRVRNAGGALAGAKGGRGDGARGSRAGRPRWCAQVRRAQRHARWARRHQAHARPGADRAGAFTRRSAS